MSTVVREDDIELSTIEKWVFGTLGVAVGLALVAGMWVAVLVAFNWLVLQPSAKKFHEAGAERYEWCIKRGGTVDIGSWGGVSCHGLRSTDPHGAAD